MASDRSLEWLGQCATKLGQDELRVLLSVARGLVDGQKVYGRLDLATDPRDFVKEALEEVRDALVYVHAQLERIQHENDP
jgi:hypothetical protein